MENHHFQWVNQLQMAISNSYVKLPEGTPKETTHIGNLKDPKGLLFFPMIGSHEW